MFYTHPTASVVTTPEAVINAAAPKLTLEEEIYALSLVDLVGESLGPDVGAVVAGDVITDPQGLMRVLMQFASSGQGQELLAQVCDLPTALEVGLGRALE